MINKDLKLSVHVEIVFFMEHSFTPVVTILFKPKIIDLGLYERWDLAIEEFIDSDTPDLTSNMRPFILYFN